MINLFYKIKLDCQIYDFMKKLPLPFLFTS